MIKKIYPLRVQSKNDHVLEYRLHNKVYLYRVQSYADCVSGYIIF
jgi:hypothetical protein